MSQQSSPSWPKPLRIGFRILFSYIIWYTLTNQFILSGFTEKVWQWVVPYFGELVFGIDASTEVLKTGSGDGLYNYITAVWVFILALISASVWSLLDQRKSYSWLLQVLVVIIRYYLVFQMAIYGVAKIMYSQFSEPAFHRLLQPFGEASPMGLLWTFMGFSYGYNLLTGGMEFLGSLLLLFRKTTTLGALVTLGVMINVMALNFFYDVPVKLLSTHLVLFCLFPALYDGQRLLNVLILNKPAQAINIPELLPSPGYQTAKNVIKVFVLVIGLVSLVVMISKYTDRSKPPMYGLYEVETMVSNQDTLPPLLTDHKRWQHIIVEYPGRAIIQTMPGDIRWFDFEVDTLNHFAVFSQGDIQDSLFYERVDSSRWIFSGIVRGDSVSIQTLRKDKEDFLLMGRGFNWVNETPFNK
ncbi:MAG: hypothetical protein KI786_06210 [Mameliella sp.]|nr:hypothetical protein [Phaeodactylibacter sp.]